MAKPSDPTNYIYRSGTSPNTRTAISQKSKIYGYMVNATQPGFQQIGVCSEFGHDESRSIEPVRGVGFGDQVAELVPGVTEPMTLTINKTLLYAVNLFQAVGYKGGVEGLVRSLKHHRWPFDIKTEIVFSQLASEDPQVGFATKADIPNEGGLNNLGNPGLYAVATVYEGCWMNSYNTSYTVDTAAVAEDCGIDCTDIFDVSGSIYGEFLDAGLNSGDATGRSLLYST